MQFHEQTDEQVVFDKWFHLIQTTIGEQGKVTTVTELASALNNLMREASFSPDKFNSSSFKKKMRRKLDAEFLKVADILQNNRGKLIFLPKTVTRENLANDYIEIQQQLEKLSPVSMKSLRNVQEVALNVRSEIKSLQNAMSWPPKISELNPDQIELPAHLQHFLSYLLHGSSQISTKTSSLGQHIIYTVHQGRFLTAKHVLLPFTVKSTTGNVELIKVLNRLGHGVSYSKLCEIDTAYAIQKISSSSTLIPEEIQRYSQVSLVYDNIDRLEET